MSSPQRADWKLLRRVARNLRSRPRTLLHFKRQEPPSHLTVTVDADFAGCRRTGKSTNGGYIMQGGHGITSWSTAQTVVANVQRRVRVLRPCEGCARRYRHILSRPRSDRRGFLKIDLETDSPDAKGIATRRGVGKVQHLEVRTLWLQDQVDRGRVRPKKIN